LSNAHLTLKIEDARREISALQAKIEEHVKFFTTNSIDYHSRDSAKEWHHERRYDEMVYSERRLGLAQQRLASLLLELTTESIDRLDSSVKTLDSSVGSLSSLTRKLVRSSKLLEYLTAIVVLAALGTASVSLLPSNPYYLLAIIAVFVALFIIWRRARKELPKI